MTSKVPAPGSPEVRGGSSRRRKIIRSIQIVVSLGLVVGIFVGILPRIADYSSVWRTIQALTWLEILTLVGVTILNIVTYWPQTVAAMPGLTLGQAAVNIQSSTTIANTLPLGGALATGVSFTMFRSWGFRTSEIALATIVTGVWNSFAKLGLPVVALAMLAVTGESNSALLIPTVIGVLVLIAAVALFAMMLWKKAFARRIGAGLGRVVSAFRRLFRKPSVEWADAAVRFRKQTIGLVSKRWLPLTLSTVVSHICLYLVLLLALRHVGVSEEELSWSQTLAVFALVRLLSALPITPGGVGLVELGYIGGLYVAADPGTGAAAEAFRAQIAAGALTFRALTYGAQIPLGMFTYLIWQRKKSWRKPVPAEDEDRPVEQRDGPDEPGLPPSGAPVDQPGQSTPAPQSTRP